jgi:tRNA threonylcarbamoyladenosine biosynthesis protein TsaE
VSASLVLTAADEAAMVTLGAMLSRALLPGSVVYLNGELGMGKTTLSRGVIRARGHLGAVKSPTYTLVEPYELPAGNIYHFDLYRLGDAQELEFMGIRDYFDGRSISLVEWPQRGAGALPPADIIINIEQVGSGRRLTLVANSPLGRRAMDELGCLSTP